MIQYFTQLDHQLFNLVNQSWSANWLDPIMKFLSSKWMFIPIYIFAIFKMFQIYKSKFWMPVLICLIAFGLADSISSKVFKPVFKRTRPAHYTELSPRLPDGMPGSKYGFVSSHAANTFAVYPLLALMIFSVYDQSKKRLVPNRKWQFFAFFISGLVAYSRVYNGVHWPADVFFGAILGLLIGKLCLFIWNNWAVTKAIES
jgi:undecaprenyl-diphosphatase